MELFKMALQAIKTELSGQARDSHEIEKLSEDDLAKLYDLCKAHDIAHFIGKLVSENQITIDNEIAKKFVKEYRIAIYKHIVQQNELEILCRKLNEHAIEHVVLKGAFINKLYKDPCMRTSCDIDILIRKENLEKVSSVFQRELAYTIAEKNYHDVSFYSKDNVHIELHFALVNENNKIEKHLSDVWDNLHNCNDLKYTYYMNTEYFVYYHIIHSAKHFFYGGCGIKPILDLWVIDEKLNYDKELVEKRLAQVGLNEYYLMLQELFAVWFEDKDYSGVTVKCEEYLVRGGTYGSEKNYNIVETNIKGKKRIIKFFSRIFVSIEDLSARYPTVKKRKALVVFYQIKRWIDIIFKDIPKKIKRRKTVDINEKKDFFEILESISLVDDLIFM